MFEGLKGMGDMMKLMGQLPRMQQKMQEVQERLRNTRIVGEAGAGMVKVTVAGTGEVLAVDIDPEVLKDAETVGPLVVSATNTAIMKQKQLLMEESSKSFGMDMPGMPGM